MAVCLVVFLLVACQDSYWPNPLDPNETQDETDAMIGIMPIFAACVLIPMGYSVFTVYFCRSSIRREIELMKQATAPATEAPKARACRYSPKALLFARCAVVAVAVIFIVVGVCAGGVEAIIAKAVAICTECIGLG